jgi:hypothetical protein
VVILAGLAVLLRVKPPQELDVVPSAASAEEATVDVQKLLIVT